MAIPLVAKIVISHKTQEKLGEEVSYYEKLDSSYVYTTVCVMKKTGVAGDIITDSMIEEDMVMSLSNISDVIPVTRADLVGKTLKLSLPQGSIVVPEAVTKEMALPEERYFMVKAIDISENINENSVLDIRIVFPNGEDYLVVSKKRVYQVFKDEEDGPATALLLRFSEEELLRFQAAKVDMLQYEGTSIYAVEYLDEIQTKAREFYPVNSDVYNLLLWDPNIGQLKLVEMESERRNILESHLKSFFGEEYMKAELSNEDIQSLLDEAIRQDENMYSDSEE